MKIVYKVLYRNGIEDDICVDVDEVNPDDLRNITDVVELGFREDISGLITLGNGRDSGSYIRIKDVIRVSVDVIKEDE